MHDTVKRIDSWVYCGDMVLPVTPEMALEDIGRGHGGAKQTRISYADGRAFETRASMRDLFDAMTYADDAVTIPSADIKIGTPQEKKQ